MNKKIIWGIVIVVVLIAGVVYVKAKNTTVDCCRGEQYVGTNWKTYINNGFGYSLKYPETWTIENKPANSTGVSHGVIFKTSEGVQIMSTNNPIKEVGYETLTLVNTEKIVVDGQQFTKQTFKNEAGALSVHLTWNEDNGEKSGEVWFNQMTDSDPTLNGILSTFKFTN